jgi:hypothetical protein
MSKYYYNLVKWVYVYSEIITTVISLFLTVNKW